MKAHQPSNRKTSPVSAKNSRIYSHLVLCVDDELMQLKVCKLLLEQAGNEVITSGDSKSALAMFGSTAVQLVVLDYSMPKLNGAELARAMRRLKPNVPIVMLSGHSERPQDADNVVDAYIRKGEEPGVLLETVRELLGHNSAPLKMYRRH